MIFLRTTTAQTLHFSTEWNAGKWVREKGKRNITAETKARCFVAVQRRLLLVAFSRDCRLRQTARKKKKHNGARFEKSRARKITRIELWDERKITNA